MNTQLETTINMLCDKFGTTAEHLWGVLMKQAYIAVTMHTIGIFLFILADLFGFFYLKKNTQKLLTSFDSDNYYIVWGLYLFFNVLILAILIIEGHKIFSPLFNPEYWAIKQLIPSD